MFVYSSTRSTVKIKKKRGGFLKVMFFQSTRKHLNFVEKLIFLMRRVLGGVLPPGSRKHCKTARRWYFMTNWHCNFLFIPGDALQVVSLEKLKLKLSYYCSQAHVDVSITTLVPTLSKLARKFFWWLIKISASMCTHEKSNSFHATIFHQQHDEFCA